MTKEPRNTILELNDAWFGFRQYGYVDENVMDLINILEDINDDLAHDRSKKCFAEKVDQAKQILDKIVASA